MNNQWRKQHNPADSSKADYFSIKWVILQVAERLSGDMCTGYFLCVGACLGLLITRGKSCLVIIPRDWWGNGSIIVD